MGILAWWRKKRLERQMKKKGWTPYEPIRIKDDGMDESQVRTHNLATLYYPKSNLTTFPSAQEPMEEVDQAAFIEATQQAMKMMQGKLLHDPHSDAMYFGDATIRFRPETLQGEGGESGGGGASEDWGSSQIEDQGSVPDDSTSDAEPDLEQQGEDHPAFPGIEDH